MKLALALCSMIVLLALLPTVVSAHVVVKPNTVGVATFQTFTMGVPNEKELPTISLRLVLPEGLEHVSPNVKPGWTIEIKKTGEGDTAKVSEIMWTKGNIPQGQRDDFLFSAKVPAQEKTIEWKAYQTYADGTIVSWDQSSEEMSHDEAQKLQKGPFSKTAIINDLAKDTTDAKTGNEDSEKTTMLLQLSLIVSFGALLLSGYSILEQKKIK